jgi:hypothetical protein
MSSARELSRRQFIKPFSASASSKPQHFITGGTVAYNIIKKGSADRVREILRIMNYRGSNAWLHSATQSRKGVAADQTFPDGVADILFNRRPFNNLDQLASDWRTNARDQIRKECLDEINAAAK